MAEHVCPVWVGYLLASPVRRLIQNPEKILAPYVKKGMFVLDIGCAMGFFSLPMARLAGETGRVLCVDMQEGMFTSLKKRARKAGLMERLTLHACTQTSLRLDEVRGTADFALAMAMIHEVPDAPRLFAEVFQALKPGGAFLIAEPKGHVGMAAFAGEVEQACQAGFAADEYLKVPRSHAALLRKPGGSPAPV